MGFSTFVSSSAVPLGSARPSATPLDCGVCNWVQMGHAAILLGHRAVLHDTISVVHSIPVRNELDYSIVALMPRHLGSELSHIYLSGAYGVVQIVGGTDCHSGT